MYIEHVTYLFMEAWVQPISVHGQGCFPEYSPRALLRIHSNNYLTTAGNPPTPTTQFKRSILNSTRGRPGTAWAVHTNMWHCTNCILLASVQHTTNNIANSLSHNSIRLVCLAVLILITVAIIIIVYYKLNKLTYEEQIMGRESICMYSSTSGTEYTLDKK